jgi:hypothetical protein
LKEDDDDPKEFEYQPEMTKRPLSRSRTGPY